MLTIKGRAQGSSDRKQRENVGNEKMNLLESCRKTPLTVIILKTAVKHFYKKCSQPQKKPTGFPQEL